MDEILVTAQRRTESKQTTPVSISAFSADTLVSNGVESAADLQKLTPGVVLNGAGNTDNTTFTIRGQGKAVIGPGLPSVITYVNEVPLPSWGSLLRELEGFSTMSGHAWQFVPLVLFILVVSSFHLVLTKEELAI